MATLFLQGSFILSDSLPSVEKEFFVNIISNENLHTQNQNRKSSNISNLLPSFSNSIIPLAQLRCLIFCFLLVIAFIYSHSWFLVFCFLKPTLIFSRTELRIVGHSIFSFFSKPEKQKHICIIIYVSFFAQTINDKIKKDKYVTKQHLSKHNALECVHSWFLTARGPFLISKKVINICPIFLEFFWVFIYIQSSSLRKF